MLQTRQGRGGHGRVPGAHLAGLASSHGVVPHSGVVLDRGNPPGSAGDTGLDAAASAVWAEPAAPGGILHARHRLSLSTGAAAITAQRVRQILPSSYPYVHTTA